MKNFITLIFLLIFSTYCYSFSLIDKLTMPLNGEYLKKSNIKLNRFVYKKVITKETRTAFSEKKSEIFKLTGILKINKKFYAIINGNTYQTGSIIKGFKILSINIHKVILLNVANNENLELKIEN